MSLSDHLDDIMDDTIPVSDVSLESLAVRRVTMDVVRDNARTRTQVKLDKNFSKKLNILYDTLRIKTAVESLEVVDYSMALEAMTGMEDPVTLRAKLTKTPSRVNKALVVSELESTSDVLPVEYEERLYELWQLYEETKETRENLAKSLESLATSFLTEINRLSSNSPIVIHEGESINLYSSPLLKVCSIDDTKLMYDKYSGALIHRFQKLFANGPVTDLLKLQPISHQESNVSAEAETDLDLDVTEEEETIASKLAEKIDNDTETAVGVENEKSVTVASSLVVEEESLEHITKAIHGNLLILLHSVGEVSDYADRVSYLTTMFQTNTESQTPNLLTDEVHFTVSRLPEAYKQVTHILDVSDVLVQQGNPIDQVLELLQFLD